MTYISNKLGVKFTIFIQGFMHTHIQSNINLNYSYSETIIIQAEYMIHMKIIMQL